MFFKLLFIFLTIFLPSTQPTKIHFFSDKKALFAQKILFIFQHALLTIKLPFRLYKTKNINVWQHPELYFSISRYSTAPHRDVASFASGYFAVDFTT